jgi:ATP-dependent phosphofructokinase / diphosphate-dependent phosphofructokinase
MVAERLIGDLPCSHGEWDGLSFQSDSVSVMTRRNAFYAQSGGVSAVINASACGVLETVRQHSDQIAKVYAGRNGIIGALTEELIDTSSESEAAIAALKHTPGAAFGSCRYKLGSLHEHRAQYERLIEVFRAYDVGYFFYNGGGDSQDTAHKVSQISAELGEPIVCIGIPKTVDNDLAITDCSPGFGSAAKYLATSLREAAFDLAAMSRSSTQVFVLEVMGRHAGWTTAACALAAEREGDAPHVLLMPEVVFSEDRFLAKVNHAFRRSGNCVIAASEGIKSPDGQFLSAGAQDAFGHAQLGGVAPIITNLIGDKLGLKCHWAVPDYLQRSARHIASETDVEQAYAVGRAAVEFAIGGRNAVMAAIRRISDAPYRWDIVEAPLSAVANQEKLLPPDFITADGFGITEDARRYLAPLIVGESYPPFRDGLPDYVKLRNAIVPRKLANTFAV